MNAYFLFQDFQTAIVGVIGFGGVIIAQFVNGAITRKRELETENRRREAVTAAVKSELEVCRDAFLRLDPQKGPTEGNKAFVSKIQRTATPPLMADLGLLKTSSLTTVLFALLTIDSVYSNFAIFAENDTDSHITISSDSWSVFAKGMNDAGKSLDKAIQTIE